MLCAWFLEVWPRHPPRALFSWLVGQERNGLVDQVGRVKTRFGRFEMVLADQILRAALCQGASYNVEVDQ